MNENQNSSANSENKNNIKKRKIQTQRLVLTALFTAISYLSMYVVNFKVMFLTFDIKDTLMAIAAMLLGPVVGVAISLIVSLIELLLISGTGFYGFIMNFISSAVFVFTASFIYKIKRTKKGSCIALLAAVFFSTAVMLIMNLLVTPFYIGATASDVAAMIPKILFPFNLIKFVVNAALVLLFYKPISTAVKRAGFGFAKDSLQGEEKTYTFNRATLLTVLVAIALIAISLVIFFAVLGGNVSFF